MWLNAAVGAVSSKVDSKDVAAEAMRARWFMTDSKNLNSAGVAAVTFDVI
jgi:hypothetical protein